MNENKSEHMKILLLGGGGFIGSHLAEALVRAQCKVLIYDRVPSPYLQGSIGVEFIQGDLADELRLLDILAEVDVVYHCISTTVPGSSMLNPVADIETNLAGTVRLLELMRKTGKKRIVFLSSGGTVYGVPEGVPVSESHPLRPLSSYGIVKVAIEHYLSMYRDLFKFEPLIVRPSNVYGPRQGKMGVQGAVSTFLNRIQEGMQIVVWGDGEVIRDYVYIEDLTRFCVTAGVSGTSGTFNCGSGIGVSVNQILAEIREVTGVDSAVRYEAGRDYDIPRIVLDCSRAEQSVGWEAKISLREGIERYWGWLNSLKGDIK